MSDPSLSHRVYCPWLVGIGEDPIVPERIIGLDGQKGGVFNCRRGWVVGVFASELLGPTIVGVEDGAELASPFA